MNILWQVLGVVSSIAVLTGGITYMLEEKSKQAIRERTTAAWMNFAQRDSLIIVRAPLTLFSTFLDALYGRKVLSWRGFWRSCVVSTLILIAALLLTGLLVGKPFGFETPPWKIFDETFQALSEASQDEAVFSNRSPEQRAALKRVFATILSCNNPRYRLLYTGFFTFLIIAVSWLMNFICLGISRRIVREMLEVHGFVALFALHTLNFILVAIACTICLSLAVVAAAPFTLSILILLGYVFVFSKLLALCLALPALLCAIWFSPIWIRVLAVIAALPSVSLFCASICALFLKPWHTRAHRVISFVLDKVALREKAVVAIAVTVGVAAVAFLSLVPSLVK